MINIDPKQIGKQAKSLGFVRDTYEKVYRLSNVLSFIENDPVLSQKVALKGGTAINLTIFSLPRLSVDIDLDFTQNVSRDEMIRAKAEITERINTYMKSQGYVLDETACKNSHALNSSVFSYTNCGGVVDKLKVEVNYMLREHLLDLQYRQTNTLPGFVESNILCVNPIEIYGAKTVALLSRAAARDLYDINNMIRNNLFSVQEIDLMRKCAVFYMVINTDTAFSSFDTSNIDTIEFSKIRADLFPVIGSGEKKYDLNGTKDTVKSALNNMLKMTDQEKEFVEEFFKGAYKPELLFSSKEIIDRAKNHPMIKWQQTKIQEQLQIQCTAPKLIPMEQQIAAAVAKANAKNQNNSKQTSPTQIFNRNTKPPKH